MQIHLIKTIFKESKETLEAHNIQTQNCSMLVTLCMHRITVLYLPSQDYVDLGIHFQQIIL